MIARLSHVSVLAEWLPLMERLVVYCFPINHGLGRKPLLSLHVEARERGLPYLPAFPQAGMSSKKLICSVPVVCM